MTMPIATNHQDRLLTINANEVPILTGTLGPGIDVQPLFLDQELGVWVIRAFFAPGVTLPKHYHTGSVYAWTIKGRWNYVEYPDQPQTAGSFLYEPGASVHTFQTPTSNTETTEVFFVVFGANVNFDDKGRLRLSMKAAAEDAAAPAPAPQPSEPAPAA